MSQQNTNLPVKTSGPPENTWHDRVSEVNDLNTVINNNSQDIENRTTVLENTDVSNIPSYSTSGAPTSGPGLTNGKVAYNTDLESPMVFKNGTWHRMSNNLPIEYDSEDLDVFLVLGQSNAEGFCFWTNLNPSLQAVDRTDNLMYLASIPSNTWAAGNWAQINPGTNTSWEIPGCFGSEVGFSDTIKGLVSSGGSSYFSKRPAMAKFSKGGTSLSHDWLPSGVSNYMYDGWQSTLSDFVTKLNNASYTHTIRGVIWFQGEQDSFTLAQANDYEQNLRGLISGVRTDVGNPALPFVIAKIKWGSDPGYETQVRTAQQNVADTEDFVTILDAANYDRQDNVHLNADSMYQYGIDAVTAMEQAIQDGNPRFILGTVTAINPTINAVIDTNPAGGSLKYVWGDGNTLTATGSTLTQRTHTYNDGLASHMLSIGVSDATDITYIKLQNCFLTSVDTSSFPNLDVIQVGQNSNLTSIDVSSNIALTSFNIVNTGITSVDLSANTLLDDVRVQNAVTDVSSLDSIINTLDANGVTNGTLIYDITPSSDAYAAYSNLSAKGWSISGTAPEAPAGLFTVTGDISLYPEANAYFGITGPIDVDYGDGTTGTLSSSGQVTHSYSDGQSSHNVSVSASPENVLSMTIGGEVTALGDFSDMTGLLLFSIQDLIATDITSVSLSGLNIPTTLTDFILRELQGGQSSITSVDVLGYTSLDTVELDDTSMDSSAVDTVIADLVTNGVNNGTLTISGSTADASSAAYDDWQTLLSRGWTITGTEPVPYIYLTDAMNGVTGPFLDQYVIYNSLDSSAGSVNYGTSASRDNSPHEGWSINADGSYSSSSPNISYYTPYTGNYYLFTGGTDATFDSFINGTDGSEGINFSDGWRALPVGVSP